MDVMKLSLDKSLLIASASSKTDGRPRWTEINVYALERTQMEALGTKRRFIAEVRACSSMQGERTKVRRVATGTLERALGWIEDSDLGFAAKVEAREWAIENGEHDPENAYRDMLERCRQQFLSYAGTHRNKCTADGDAKAATNQALADEIASVLMGD